MGKKGRGTAGHLRQSVPPRIFIRMGTSTGTEITVQQQKLLLLGEAGHAPPGSAQRTYHCLLSSVTVPARSVMTEPNPPEPEHTGQSEGAHLL